ncbi:potassium-transporting ATPase subunit KdpA [Angustibacter speluncae]
MSSTVAGVLTVLVLVAALAVVHKPLGDHVFRSLTSPDHLRVERAFYRLTRVDPDADQRWSTYALSVLGFSLASVLLLYLLQRTQQWLPLSLGLPAVPPDGAFNTAISFVTNTNWQWYSGEAVMGHTVQMAGLAVQNFVSAAVGLCVAVALIRGFTRSVTDRLGSFWVDLTRTVVRVLLPLSMVGALVLVASGVVQNLSGPLEVTTLTGGAQTLPGGPVASQEVIKELGTNGGGFYNANSAHPFESPSPFTNLFEIFLLLVIPFSLPRTFGRMVGNTRQGYALLATTGLLWFASVTATAFFERQGRGLVPEAVGAAMEGKEVRFGIPSSALFAASTTGTSTGAVNSFHDSFTAGGGGVVMLNMMLGEVSPGGVGAGLYGILVLAIVAVFLAGLMVGRTPEYLGKKIGKREMTCAALYVLAMPTALLVGAAVAAVTPAGLAGLQDSGSHGLSEILYAFASAANNNGSAFAGLTVATPFYNTALGLAMLVGRFVPIVLVLALAGSLAAQRPVPSGPGTLPTTGPLFVTLLTGVVVVVAGLTFLPALMLAPIAEALQ